MNVIGPISSVSIFGCHNRLSDIDAISLLTPGILDWDDTRIVFTKRELLNFLKLVPSIVALLPFSRGL